MNNATQLFSLATHFFSPRLMLRAMFLKELNGLPGARPNRLKSAQNVQHCALSLVGEPIMVSMK